MSTLFALNNQIQEASLKTVATGAMLIFAIILASAIFGKNQQTKKIMFTMLAAVVLLFSLTLFIFALLGISDSYAVLKEIQQNG